MSISYGKQYISDEDIQAVVDVLKSDYLTQGPAVAQFEKDFAHYIGVQYAVAVSNGTAALHLSAMALDVKPGDKILTTPISFAATANCIKYCGADVEFIDINPETFLIDLDKLEAKLVASPQGTYQGIIPVDFAGYPVDLERLKKIADQHGLWILEDACHAPGGYFIDSKKQKQYCGNGQFAELAIFSFHPVKHIATGEGGMITTNDKALYDKLILLRTHGITKDESLLKENHGGWYYEMQELGYNYRLSDIQAALGISQLKRANDGIVKRQAIAKRYTEALQSRMIFLPHVESVVSHAYHLYIVQVKDRLGLYNHLRKHDIFAQVHYIPIHLQPYYHSLGFKQGDFPLAEEYYQYCLSLPMYPTLTETEQQFVIDKIIEFIS